MPVIPPFAPTVFSLVPGSVGVRDFPEPDLPTEGSPLPAFLRRHDTVILGPHTEAVARSARETSGLTEAERDRLTHAYEAAGNAGSLRQLYTAKAVEHLFVLAPVLDASETSLTLHFHEGIASALRDRDAVRGNKGLQSIFRTMEEGPGVDVSAKEAVEALTRAGLDAATIAKRLSGTLHTAFLKDPAIADALVSLLLENAQTLDPNHQRRRYSRAVLLEEIGRKIDAGEPLSADALTDLLERTGFTTPPSVAIRIKSGPEFDAKVGQWGEVVGCESPGGCRHTLFRRVRGAGEIWVRDIEPSSRSEAIRQWVGRLVAIPHETAHAGQADFTDRVATEVLAGLAEQAWRMRNYDIDAWILAARLRLNIVQYLKLMAMWAYRIKPEAIRPPRTG